MPTIRDVAKLAKVSVATVSRVMNGGYVSDATKKKVLESMKELNYEQNIVAQSLNHKKSKTIALVIPDITNPYFPQLARAVEDVAHENGYTILLFNSDEESEKTDNYIRIAQQRYIDGIILATSITDYKDIEIPIVVLDRVIDPGIDSIVSKNKEGGKIATKHLIEIGCKKIAHLRGPKNVTSANERYEGYLEIVKSLPWYSNKLTAQANFDIKLALETTTKLLIDHPDIDGIFAGNDLMAVGAIKAIKKIGKRIPEDVALIGFDDIEFTHYIEPELSTIQQPMYEMGALGTKILLDKINGKHNNNKIHQLDIKLIVRKSTKR